MCTCQIYSHEAEVEVGNRNTIDISKSKNIYCQGYYTDPFETDGQQYCRYLKIG